MTAGADLNRLLWAVGEARRLRRAEIVQAVGAERHRGDAEDGVLDQPAACPPR